MARVAITGANRGIGLALATIYAGRGDEVVAIGRSSSRALEATGATVIDGVDVADFAAVATLASRRELPEIDLLINVAGILDNESVESPDWPDRVRRQLEVNAMGPLAVTLALRSHLKAGAKVAILSSRVGSLADNGSGGHYGYRMSKAAVNMAGVNLAHDLKPSGVAVFLLHPGYVRTEMTGGHGNTDAETSAAQLVALIDRLTMADTGTFWHAAGYALPW